MKCFLWILQLGCLGMAWEGCFGPMVDDCWAVDSAMAQVVHPNQTVWLRVPGEQAVALTCATKRDEFDILTCEAEIEDMPRLTGIATAMVKKFSEPESGVVFSEDTIVFYGRTARKIENGLYTSASFLPSHRYIHDLSGRSYFKHAQRRMYRGWQLGWSWGWLVGLSTPVLAWLGQREHHQVGFSLANMLVAGPEVGFSIGEDHLPQQTEVTSASPTPWWQSLWWGVVVRPVVYVTSVVTAYACFGALLGLGDATSKELYLYRHPASVIFKVKPTSQHTPAKYILKV
ncbi:MAG: hypothetical protein OXT67_00495 [Zetaproteobacteria bacterium]|nr:hypothetical protein [Zetaproteobacteria bacterium]